MSEEFSQLMSDLKQHYKRIIIDLAPIQAVSDALVVGEFADTTIYVIKAESTLMSVAKRGVERLRESGINVAGAVISQVNLAKISSYGGDYYYQGYYDYYGYGYGDSGTKLSRKKQAPQIAPVPMQQQDPAPVEDFDAYIEDSDSNDGLQSTEDDSNGVVILDRVVR